MRPLQSAAVGSGLALALVAALASGPVGSVTYWTGLVVPAQAHTIAQNAQTQAMLCAPREEAIGEIKAVFGEVPVAIGMLSGGGAVEVLATPDGESFTVLVTHPEGMSCVLVAGRYWQAHPARARPPIDPQLGPTPGHALPDEKGEPS